MPKSLQLCHRDDDEHKVLSQAINRWRPGFAEMEVNIGIVMVIGGWPAIKVNGHAALAVAKIVSDEQRLTDKHDVLIKIDYLEWANMGDHGRLALLSHIVYGLNLVNYDEFAPGGPTCDRDDRSRPLIERVTPDWLVCGGFYDIVMEYREDSPEYQQLTQARAKADDAIKGVPNPKYGTTPQIDFGEDQQAEGGAA